MSRVVALDTSTWWGGVALVEGGVRASTVVVAETGLRVRDSHTTHLLAMLEALLAQAGWTRSSVDAWAASRGPGSFTGLRVGLGTVRGLGLASGRPCLGVVSLQALAEAHGPAELPRLPMLDAGRGEVFGALYDAGSSPPEELLPPWVEPPGSALARAGAGAVVFGPGAERHADRIGAVEGFRFGASPRSVAAAVGRLALMRLAAGADDGEGLSPLYVRPADAELHGGGG